jgi:hypothetical protein
LEAFGKVYGSKKADFEPKNITGLKIIPIDYFSEDSPERY